MKKTILIIGIVTILTVLPNFLNAKEPDVTGEDAIIINENNAIQEEIKDPSAKNYDHDDLLDILAEIQDDLDNEDLKEAQNKSDDILGYLNFYKNISKNSDAVITNSYGGKEVLELKYGSWYNPKLVILPFHNLDNKRISYDYLKDNVDLSNFRQNQIIRARIRYIIYDIKNENISKNIYNLLASLSQGNESDIRKNIENIYEDLFKDCDNKISLVSKIRDNLTLSRHLIASKQSKAAENSVGVIDSLTVRLIEVTSNNPDEQKRIKNLRKELNTIGKLSDENYIAQWETIPEEIGEWWKY